MKVENADDNIIYTFSEYNTISIPVKYKASLAAALKECLFAMINAIGFVVDIYPFTIRSVGSLSGTFGIEYVDMLFVHNNINKNKCFVTKDEAIEIIKHVEYN
jgi:hypothetical protein